MTWDNSMSIKDMKTMLDSRLAELESSTVALSTAVNCYNYEKTMSVFSTVEEILEEARELYEAIEDKELTLQAEELEKEYKKGE